MDKEPTTNAADIHQLIQQDGCDIYSLIRKRTDEVDKHVLVCEACHKKVIGCTSELPKLRARMTVQFPDTPSLGQRVEQMKHLKAGQCLPCGCEVTRTAWTREEANGKFYVAFAAMLGISESQSRLISLETRFADLPVSIKQLRRLRDTFWFPDGSSGSPDARDAEEGDEVRQLPETVGDFITELLKIHSGYSYSECSDHWCP